MNAKICSIDGCQKPVYARGWCQMHYTRSRKHGDPLDFGAFSHDAEENFVAQVAWSGECLLWTGHINAKGYGQLRVAGRQALAHRYAYERENGPIPDRMVVDHTCWTPACVLRGHLRLATPAENQQNRSGAHRDRKHDLPRGVYRSGRRYRAQVRTNGRSIHLGTFDTIEAASSAAAAKRTEMFGEYAGRA